MQQQPLAFTLVKTVVSARDEGKVLSPALATAWDLLRTELSPAHRVIASEVSWSPNHQEDLKFVIEGVRKQFEKDPDLENEFLAFLAEVEPFGKAEHKATIFPILGGVTAGSNIPAAVGELSFVVEPDELSVDQEAMIEEDFQVDELVEQLNENPVFKQEPIELDIPDTTSESLNFEDLEAPEVHIDTPLEQAAENVEVVEKVAVQNLAENPREDFSSVPSKTSPYKSSSSMLKYWPAVAGTLLIALVTFGALIYSDPNTSTPTLEEVGPELIPSEVITEDLGLVIAETEPSVYSTPSIARLSHTVDSLRKSGDYKGALTKQRELAQRLENEGSPSEEKSQAYSELAILFAAQNNLLQAVVEQRKSLTFARQAYAKTDPALGRSHLKLASFYTDNGELHMARAHLQQARKIFGQAQELVTPTDLEKSEEVAEKILNAS